MFHQRGRIKGVGWVERPVAAIWYLRDGQVMRVLSYFSWNEALEAAGLEQ